MHSPEFKEKFVAFIDIIGFKNLVKSAEDGTGKNLNEIEKLLKHLGTLENRDFYIQYGPHICPTAPYIQKDLDFRITQISDCVVASSEVSPSGVINLVFHCWAAVLKLLNEGIMCRGYITRGMIYHTDTQMIGSAYQNAVEKEKFVSVFKKDANERGTPFVEIDNIVCNYVNENGDVCVKEMFSRFVQSDGLLTAIYPFKRLAHSFIITDKNFNPEQERKSNANIRINLINFKNKISSLTDKSNAGAIKKANHYIEALDKQIKVCDDTDNMINRL